MRNEAGETLIETLLSLAILGIAIVAIVGGLGQAIFSSSLHRDQSENAAFLVSSVEAVKDPAQNAYVSCATPASYTNLGSALPSGWTMSVQSVEFGQGDAAGTWAPVAQCLDKVDPADFNDPVNVHVQRVTLDALSPRGIHHTLSVVKRG